MKERTTQGNGFPSIKLERGGTRGMMCTTIDEVEQSEQPVGLNEPAGRRGQQEIPTRHPKPPALLPPAMNKAFDSAHRLTPNGNKSQLQKPQAPLITPNNSRTPAWP